MSQVPLRIEQQGSDVLLWIKAVPGASRNQISGILGDRLKIRIAAPPEDGKANAAICDLLAESLNLRLRGVTVESGQTNPEKTVRLANTTTATVKKQLKLE